MKVEIGKKAQNYLFKCEEKIFVKLFNACADLRMLQGDITRLKGRKNEFRVKLPPYRIIFKLDEASEMLTITKIDTRGDAYKG